MPGYAHANERPLPSPLPPDWNIEQFVRSVREMDARGFGSNGESAAHPPEHEPIHSAWVSCSRETWDDSIGKPENVRDHCREPAELSVQTWQQTRTDGRIVCVGHLYRNHADVPWLILFRFLVPSY
jgi:hypothetical protein